MPTFAFIRSGFNARPKRAPSPPSVARSRARVRGAFELKLFEVEVGVGYVELHLGGFALRVEREGDPSARVRVDDRLAPLDSEGVEVPVFEVADVVGRRRKTQD